MDRRRTISVVISIHTPVKGVTSRLPRSPAPPFNFNPHTREGCDQDVFPSARGSYHFNPHTREGCDRGTCARSAGVSYFNPHTREGCDEEWLELWLRCQDISIHTPVKGVTASSGSSRGSRQHFNPHTREGCDCLPQNKIASSSNFNPHTREGCDGLMPTR